MSYIVGHPIKHPQDFYGRCEQKKRFFEIISGTQAQSITILGARRSGKTSFLKHVAHPTVMATYLNNPDDYVMVYIDVSACRTPHEFYQRTILKLNQLLSDLQPINLWSKPENGQATMFHLESILCQFPDRRIILLLDEFDKIRKGAFDQDFLTELRALASVWEYELACITASYWDLYQLGADVGLPPTSPFYNIFYPTPIYMDNMALPDLQELILKPTANLSYQPSEQDVNQIVQVAGSLPFFVQATASAWVHAHLSKRPFNFDELFNQLVNDLSSYFVQWWRLFPKIEQDILVTIAHQKKVNTLPYSKIEISEALRWLKSCGFIVDGLSGWEPNGDIFKYWLQHLPGKAIKATKNSDALQTINGDLLAETIDLVPIYQKIVQHFSQKDILMLCFEMSIDEEQLSYSNKKELTKEFLLQMKRQGRVDALISHCQSLRPNIHWLEAAS